MPRQARLDALRTLHHVNYSWDREAKKRRIVDDEADREEFVVRMIRIAEDTETVLYAWSLMKLKLFCGSSFQTGNEEKR